MTKREQLIEQYEDALFALLMDSVAEEEGKKAIELNERLKADPEAEVPAEVRRRCEKLIRQEFNRKKARNLGRMTWKMVQRISVAVMLLLVLLTTAMAASEQLRLSILNVVIRTCEQYTEFTFEKEGNKDIEQVPQSASTNAGRGPSLVNIKIFGCVFPNVESYIMSRAQIRLERNDD